MWESEPSVWVCQVGVGAEVEEDVGVGTVGLGVPGTELVAVAVEVAVTVGGEARLGVGSFAAIALPRPAITINKVTATMRR